jgi:hypothetical protein
VECSRVITAECSCFITVGQFSDYDKGPLGLPDVCSCASVREILLARLCVCVFV